MAFTSLGSTRRIAGLVGSSTSSASTLMDYFNASCHRETDALGWFNPAEMWSLGVAPRIPALGGCQVAILTCSPEGLREAARYHGKRAEVT